jgi:hypothetical protein
VDEHIFYMQSPKKSQSEVLIPLFKIDRREDEVIPLAKNTDCQNQLMQSLLVGERKFL